MTKCMKRLYILMVSSVLCSSTFSKEIEISRLPLSVETTHPQHIKESISKINIQDNDLTLSGGTIGEENTIINRENYKNKYPEKFDSNGNYIVIHKVSPKIGMTKSDVLNSLWGEPSTKRSTESKYGITEYWYYKYLGSITFNNGKVEFIHRN